MPKKLACGICATAIADIELHRPNKTKFVFEQIKATKSMLYASICGYTTFSIQCLPWCLAQLYNMELCDRCALKLEICRATNSPPTKWMYYQSFLRCWSPHANHSHRYDSIFALECFFCRDIDKIRRRKLHETWRLTKVDLSLESSAGCLRHTK